MINFICDRCQVAADAATEWREAGALNATRRRRAERLHGECPGGTWCACQHRVRS